MIFKNRNSISPFGESAYTKGERPAAPVKLEPGKTLRLQYAVYFHNGNTQVGRVGDVYQQFLRQTREVVDSGNQP